MDYERQSFVWCSSEYIHPNIPSDYPIRSMDLMTFQSLLDSKYQLMVGPPFSARGVVRNGARGIMVSTKPVIWSCFELTIDNDMLHRIHGLPCFKFKNGVYHEESSLPLYLHGLGSASLGLRTFLGSDKREPALGRLHVFQIIPSELGRVCYADSLPQRH